MAGGKEKEKRILNVCAIFGCGGGNTLIWKLYP